MSYRKEPLQTKDIKDEVCYRYGTGTSHENIVAGAGCRFYSFADPRPGQSGKIYPDRYIINSEGNRVRGINFNDKNGDFACAYEGKDYDDLLDQNHKDIQVQREEACKDVNLKYGAKREMLPSRIGDRSRMFDDRDLKREFAYQFKEVELKENSSDLYDRYTGLTNPVNGHTMSCTAIYTNKVSDRYPKEEVQYVELRDKETKDTYHYIAERGRKSIDQQIQDDASRKSHVQFKETTNTQSRTMNQGVTRS